MKKFSLKLGVVAILLGGLLSLSFASTVLAQQGFVDELDKSPNNKVESKGILNDSTVNILEQFQDASGFQSFSGRSHKDGINQAGLDSLSGIIYSAIDILKYVVGILAGLFITVTIAQMIMAGSEKSEEEYGRLKNHLLYAVLSVIAIIAIEYFFKNVFVVDTANFLESSNVAKEFALRGSREIQGIYRFIQAIIGAVAVLMIVVAGFRLVGNAGEEEVLAKLKSQVIYGVAGLLLVSLSELVVTDILFGIDGQKFDVNRGKELLVSLTNFASGFIALASFLSFIYAGYLYVVSGSGVVEDNAEKVKKIIIGGIIAILVAGGAFAAVNTFIRLDSGGSPEMLQNQLDEIR